MAIQLNDNIKVNAGKPVEAKYLNGLVPYVNVSEVNTIIPIAERFKGLTVNIDGVEYWYKDGVSDLDLIEKANASVSSNVRDVENYLTTTGITATTSSDFIGIVSGSTVYLPPTPTIGLQLTISDIGGKAFDFPITIDGSGNNIDADPQGFIDSDYGTLTLMYNGTFWKSISFVP